MPRIAREEHARIRERVEVGGEKVAAVAASYGCTPANIYAILTKLRQTGEITASAKSLPAVPEEVASAAVIPVQQIELLDAAHPEPAAGTVPPLVDPVPLQAAASSEPPPRPVPVRPTLQGPGHSAVPRSGRTGYALLMRADDGEEAVNPFRSLDELLAAAKPILRNAARSPDPVWFSIQPVDLDALEDAF